MEGKAYKSQRVCEMISMYDREIETVRSQQYDCLDTIW